VESGFHRSDSKTSSGGDLLEGLVLEKAEDYDDLVISTQLTENVAEVTGTMDLM